MLALDRFEVPAEIDHQRCRDHRLAVLATLALPDGDLEALQSRSFTRSDSPSGTRSPLP